MKYAMIVLAFLAMFGCENTKGKMARSGVRSEFEVRVGGKTMLDDQNISIGFVSVIEDSRCPTGARCASEGNGRISLKLTNGKDSVEKIVHLNTTSEPLSIEFAGYAVRIKELEPYPVATSPSYFDNYVATLVVTAL
jgi:hypothetical protein